jgi:molecular chaperone GrpE
MVTKRDQAGSSKKGRGSPGGDEAEISVSLETPEEECNDVLLRKDEEIKQLQDRILRLAAEMENTRKRIEREKSEGISFANERLIRELFPVIDNLERAVQHGEDEANCQSLLDGVRMTLKSFEDVLGRFGCMSFESEGKPFDPNFHEAVMQRESADHPEKTILQELQKGYMLRDRLVRPAMVIVSKGPQDPESETE